jgi:hypothetical protein
VKGPLTKHYSNGHDAGCAMKGPVGDPIIGGAESWATLAGMATGTERLLSSAHECSAGASFSYCGTRTVVPESMAPGGSPMPTYPNRPFAGLFLRPPLMRPGGALSERGAHSPRGW